MKRDRFWLTDAQFARIEPHLPTDTRGMRRVDDRRVISGIVQILKSGGRWIDAPSDFGPRKTLYSTCAESGRTTEPGLFLEASPRQAFPRHNATVPKLCQQFASAFKPLSAELVSKCLIFIGFFWRAVSGDDENYVSSITL